MTITCTRKLTFDSGHRILNHEGRCKVPHGHTYTAYISACAVKLDHIGRIVDFSVLKEIYGSWIDQNFDHGFLVWEKDIDLLRALSSVLGSKVYYCPFNPTAEEIAKFLGTHYEFTQALAEFDVEIVKVKVYETPNCYAEWIRDE